MRELKMKIFRRVKVVFDVRGSAGREIDKKEKI
jgi:hypothetical protein